MFGGKFNLGSLMKNAKMMQEKLATIRVTGEAGGGWVTVIITAQHETIQVSLADELLKEPKEIQEELIKAAFNDANQKAAKIMQEQMMSAETLLGGSTDDNEK